ncbi:FHA domain-containing protein [Frankia sp. AgPm24]|uniref:FHA domain-containing protein n=1 Tax=Frankia sp. AgPm24 TaxID=631128 RepID=UPI002010390F|nr:FHA domain-containing protein [Frankia sp. AgPm24]MCK9923498.1 FHA domain-containing protein [Frankia sp. AgPm24]
MAGLDHFRVVVESGRTERTGVVVRLPGALVVARVDQPETAEITTRLLGLCAEVAAEVGTSEATMGRRLVRRVAGVLADADPERVPDFSLLTTVNDRVAALVHGAMDVVVSGPSGLTLSGVDSATWVDRLLPADCQRIDVAPTGLVDTRAGDAGGLDFPLDLRLGTVAGVGVSLLLSDAPAIPISKSSADRMLAAFDPSQDPKTGAAPVPASGARVPDPSLTTPPALAPLLSQEEEAHRRRAAAEPTQAADLDELDELDPDPATELAGRDLYGEALGRSGHDPSPNGQLGTDHGAAGYGHGAAAGPGGPGAAGPVYGHDAGGAAYGHDGGAPGYRHDGGGQGFGHDAGGPGFGPGPGGSGYGPGGGAMGQQEPLTDDLTDDEHDALTQLPGQTFTVSDLIEDDEAATMLPNSSKPQVEGVLCPNGHFNHPQSPYCVECGQSLAQQAGHTVWGPRPPIGILVFDDGMTLPVDMDLVIGRQPDRDDAVRAGTARALPVEDGESAISRVHAIITLTGWDAVITDQGSANGTYIAPPEATVWTPLNPHQEAPLTPGTRVQVGKRTFVFNSNLHP